MSHITQAELHSLSELLDMEASMFEKFLFYRRHSPESHVQELCDQLLDRSRQHLTALEELLEAELAATVPSSESR